MNGLLFSLLPSPTMTNFERGREIVQTIYAAPALLGGVGFYTSQKIAQSLVNSLPAFQFIVFPSSVIRKVAGEDDVLLRRVSWIAPLTGMVIATLVSHTFYTLFSFSLINGAILGSHSAAMLLFSQASWRDDVYGLMTLEGAITSLFLNPARFQHLSQAKRLFIEFKSAKVASITFFVSSIALTCLLKNPILANGVAYPLAIITKIVTKCLIDALTCECAFALRR